MSNQTYYALDKQLFKLFEEKEYQQVLDLIEQEQANFPTHTLYFVYWRICMTNLLGKREEALRLFREAVEQGYWFTPDWMAEDEDLVSLHPLPEFQSLLATCRQRLLQAQAEVRPELRVLPPDPPVAPAPLLIALHGNMSNSNDTAEEWRAITGRGWLLALPQSSQLAGQTAFVWNDRARSISEICAHFATVNEQYSVDAGRVVLGGFSKGGGLAIWMALHQLIPAAGFVVLGPFLSSEELEALAELLATHKPAGIRGSIIIGEDDESCLKGSRQVAELMHAHDLPCTLEIIPGLGHEYPSDFSEHVTRGLAFVEQR